MVNLFFIVKFGYIVSLPCSILPIAADTVERSGDEKLQYDRDFLLKFQFSPICTAKPDGLPNIEIVLDRAHAGTKALDQGQR